MELEIPIFPLPDLVFFPHTLLPLHIFEPRYRQMIADCLEGDRRLAVVMLKPGWERDYEGSPAVYPVAGAGEIIQCERLADGRYNVLLRGECRVRIKEELPSGKLYRVVRAVVVRDKEPPTGTEALMPGLQSLMSAYCRLLESLGQKDSGFLAKAGEPSSPGALIDRVASVAVPDPRVRQHLLETLDVQERLRVTSSIVFDLLLLVTGGTKGTPLSKERLN